MSNLVINSELFQSVENKVYRDHKFDNCEFMSTDFTSKDAKCKIYNSRFINCVFNNCTIDVNASYSAFIECQFINCKFGNRKNRKEYAIFFRCNFDNSKIDELTGVKMKRCSFNGSVIKYINDSIFVKCSDKYIEIETSGTNVNRVNMGNLVKKVVSTAASVKKPKNSKIKTVRFSAGDTKDNESKE